MNNSSHIQSNSNKSCARKRDYRLVVDGKYNRKAIMQRAWAFMKVYKGYTLKSALRQAWIDAILAMEDYNYSQNIKPHLPKFRTHDEKACTPTRQVTWPMDMQPDNSIIPIKYQSSWKKN